MPLTIKFLKGWGFNLANFPAEVRTSCQQQLDGGAKIIRFDGRLVLIENAADHYQSCYFPLETPGDAVKFAAALNKLRRPLRLLKEDLDKDWARRVKERDNQICALCGFQGDRIGETILAHIAVDEETGEEREVKERVKKDVLTAHHWLKTKARAGMARWARPCGVTVHYAEHIHTLHENPCWVDLERVYRYVAITEGEEAIKAALALAAVPATEKAVRALWLERCGKKEAAP